MKIYCGWKDVPELAGLSPKERREVVRDCFSRYGFGLWQFWAGLLAIAVFGALGMAIGVTLQYGLGLSAVVHYACQFLGLMIGLLIYGLIYYSIVLERLRPHIRDYLARKKGQA